MKSSNSLLILASALFMVQSTYGKQYLDQYPSGQLANETASAIYAYKSSADIPFSLEDFANNAEKIFPTGTFEFDADLSKDEVLLISSSKEPQQPQEISVFSFKGLGYETIYVQYVQEQGTGKLMPQHSCKPLTSGWFKRTYHNCSGYPLTQNIKQNNIHQEFYGECISCLENKLLQKFSATCTCKEPNICETCKKDWLDRGHTTCPTCQQ